MQKHMQNIYKYAKILSLVIRDANVCVSLGVRVATVITRTTRSCAPYIGALLASVPTSVFSFLFLHRTLLVLAFAPLRLCASALLSALLSSLRCTSLCSSSSLPSALPLFCFVFASASVSSVPRLCLLLVA